MARPRKQEHERRTASVRADLTEAEKAYVQEQAVKAGLSEAEYTRRRVLGFAVASTSGARCSDPAIVTELNRIGNNVNQLTRAVHTDRDFAKFWREVGQELRRVLAKVVKIAEA